MDLQAFWKSKGISDKVAEVADYKYFEQGAVDEVVEACLGLGKSDEGVRGWARMFEDTDGVVIPTVCLVTGEQKMPQVKPFISVKIGQPKIHFHGSDRDVMKLLPSHVNSAYCVNKKSEGRRKLVFRHTHDLLGPDELQQHLTTFHTRTPEADAVHAHSITCYNPKPIQNHINKGVK